MKDFAQNFFEQYSQGDLIGAIGNIVPTPESSYDPSYLQDKTSKKFQDYIDASLFGKIEEAHLQNFILNVFLESQNPSLMKSILGLEQQLFSLLTAQNNPMSRQLTIYQWWLSVENEEVFPETHEIESYLTLVPKHFRQLLSFHLTMAQGWQKLKRTKPLLLGVIGSKFANLHRWYPLQYSLAPPLISVPSGQIPVIFCEPIKANLTSSFVGKPAIFICSSVAIFFQMLQFPAFADSLCEPDHLLYILELYPNLQFTAQAGNNTFKNKEFTPIFLTKTKHLEAYSPVLMQALQDYFSQTDEINKIDSPLGNWLYKISNRLLFSIRSERLGESRAPALQIQLGQMQWHDPHKGLPPPEKSLGPEVQDNFQILLSKLASKREIHENVKRDKILLAHIVPQIVSGGHAPTRLLENIVIHHDRSRFDVMVMSTEVLQKHVIEYPFNYFYSEPSEIRGASTIKLFQEHDVDLFIHNKIHNYLQDAIQLTELFNEKKIDIAIFHGPDILNNLAAQMVNTPVRVLFEHGTQPSYPGFDLAIVSSVEALDIYHEHYKKLDTKVVALPFAVDMRKGWLSAPFARVSLGIPEEYQVMTTISTKLDLRLNDEMCHVIATILQRVPKSCYAPIGKIVNRARIEKIFSEYGVANRFFPLDERKNPSQWARSMHLYLNEFPEGSCLAILDAMASGCPVVTMHDKRGPQQARYGGNFFGVDRAITSGKKEEYIELACRLLNDQAVYNEWREHALQQYEKFADVKGYVRKLEEILINTI